jgi:prephenate dehydratase
VFDRVESGGVEAAVIPIENSLAGSVAEHFDLLLAREVFIHGEMYLRIRHNLIAAPGVKVSDVRRVFSHPVALDQCRNFFGKHHGIQAVPFYNTTGRVLHVIDEKLRDGAAITAKRHATAYEQACCCRARRRPAELHAISLITKSKKIGKGANKTRSGSP